MNTFNITLDLNKGKVTTPIRIRQGDLDGTTIHALILDHGASVDLTGLTAAFVMELPGGEHYYRKTATVGDGTVDVTINEVQAASVTGRTTRAYFQFFEGSTMRASTGSVTVDILPDALEGHTVPEDYDSAIQDAIDNLNDAVEHIADTVEDVLEDHPEWTTTVQNGSISQVKLARDVAEPLDRLMYRLDNLHTHECAEAEVVTASDAARTPVAGLTIYGRSTQDGMPTPSAPVPIESVEGNLLDPAAATPNSSKGLTATYEGDGWFRVSGTVTGSAAGIVMLWGSADASVAYIDAPGDHLCLAIEDDGLLASNDVGIQIYGRSSGSDTGQYDIYYTSGGHLTQAGKYSGYVSRVCIYINAVATGMVIDGRVKIALYRSSMLCPYVPYGHAGLWAQGRNLLPHGKTAASANGVTATRNADGSYTLSGTATETGDLSLAYDFGGIVHLRNGETYHFAAMRATKTGVRVTLRVNNLSTSTAVYYFNDASGTGDAWTANADGLAATSLYVNVTSGTNVDGLTVYPQLELGSTATAYQPYTSTVTPVPLDGHALRSLPDGTRDELTVDERGHVTLVQRVGSVDLGTLTWGYNSNGYFVTTGVTDKAAGNYNLVCDAYQTSEVASAAAMPDKRIKGNASSADMYIKDSSYTTAADLKASLDGVAMIYALATPVTHDLGTVDPVALQGPDLTAQPIPDTTMALTYEVDANVADETALACIAPVEGDTATANYAVGGYLVHGGQLCRVTTAIATGEAISIGTNVTATTVMAEILSLVQ